MYPAARSCPKVIEIDEATLLSTNGKHIIIINFYVNVVFLVDSSEEVVKRLEGSGFSVHTHWEALVGRLGLSQDDIVGLRWMYGDRGALLEGIDRVLQQCQLTWSDIDKEVRALEPTVDIVHVT